MTVKKADSPELVGVKNRLQLTSEVEIRINLERVLLLAQEDRAFRTALLADPDTAVAQSHLELSTSERSLLAAMPRRPTRSPVRPKIRSLKSSIFFSAPICYFSGRINLVNFSAA